MLKMIGFCDVFQKCFSVNLARTKSFFFVGEKFKLFSSIEDVYSIHFYLGIRQQKGLLFGGGMTRGLHSISRIRFWLRAGSVCRRNMEEEIRTSRFVEEKIRILFFRPLEYLSIFIPF